MKTDSVFTSAIAVVLFAALFPATLFAASYDSQDIIFRGPWSFVQTKYQGQDVVIAIAPNAEGHDRLVAGPRPSVKIPPGLYQLTLPNAAPTLPSKPALPYILFTGAQITQGRLDQILAGSLPLSRYVFILPRPDTWSGVPSSYSSYPPNEESNVDDQFPVRSTSTNRAEYSAAIALRYHTVSLNPLAIAGTPEGTGGPLTYTFTPSNDFTFDISPSNDDIRPICHAHEKMAFLAGRCLIGHPYYVDVAPYYLAAPSCLDDDPQKAHCPTMKWSDGAAQNLTSVTDFLKTLPGSADAVAGLEKIRPLVVSKALRNLSDREWDDILQSMAAAEKKLGPVLNNLTPEQAAAVRTFWKVKEQVAINYREEHGPLMPFGVSGHDCKAPMLMLSIK